MATTIRGGGAGKEKRGTSPSSSVIKKSTKPSSSTPTSSSHGDEKISSPTDGKSSVPNYLRPTISSKKVLPESSTQKPALNRRRSFDRPPPSSQVQKAIRGVSSVRENRPLRSSSFSSKSTTSITPHASSHTRPTSSERPSVRKDTKGESHLSKSKSTLKRNTLSSTSTRKETSAASSSSSSRLGKAKKAPKSVTSETSSVDNCDSHSVDQLVIEDDMVNIDHEVESLPEISEMPDSSKELGDPTNLMVEGDHKDVVSPKDEDHDQEVISPMAADQVSEESATQEVRASEHHQEPKEEVKDPYQESVGDSGDHQQPEVETAEQNQTGEISAGIEEGVDQEATNVDTTETEEKKESESSEKEGGDDTVREDESEAKDDKETEKEKEKEKQNVASPPAASSAPATVSAPVKAQTPAGKKENAAYNDVIEETATKLMSKKNKVLALAGAFETVISLQDTSKN